eukprot:scaffold23953_cov127-Cylindrotheca_fusiformis.AAC.1
MSRLSHQERQLGQEDLHGVSAEIVEDFDEIETALQQLDGHLNSFKHGTAYETAERMKSDYVSNRDFRIMFLRGNRYDTKTSTFQMIRFFETKLQLFGIEKLVQDVTLRDLDEDDRNALQDGSRQILPQADRANRRIHVAFPGLRKNKTAQNELRACFYLVMKLLESQDVQIRGIVVVVYSIGRFRDLSNGAGFVENAKLWLSLPVHIAGVHFCSDTVAHHILVSAAVSSLPLKMKSRMKAHLGSHLECQYRLCSFGIPREVLLPSLVDDGGAESHLVWYREQYLREVSAEVPKHLMHLPNVPGEDDVLFGRKRSQRRGNRLLYQLIECNSEVYDVGSRSDKRYLTGMVIQEVHATGGRFLKQDGESNFWKEVSTEEAHEKIAQTFRNFRRPRARLAKTSSTKQGNGGNSLLQPGPIDVLFGRQRSNTGNRHVRQLVADLAAEYESASKVGKGELTNYVLREMKYTGARFLKQNADDTWVEVSDSFARSKISKQFSNSRRMQSRPSL